MSHVREGRTKSQFLYNDKEPVEGFDLGWYDYGARYYASDLGRWHRIDNLSEIMSSISPYNYVNNNPVSRVDPDGNNGWDVVKGAMVALVDDATGVNLRGYMSYTDAADYNKGQDFGDRTAMIIGGAETGIGLAMVEGGATTATGAGVATLVTGGVGSPVTAPAAATGLAVAGTGVVLGAHGANTLANGVNNLNSRKGRVKEKIEDGGDEGARFVGDTDGKLIDTESTPRGSYKQPDGSRTDVLQDKPHYSKKTKEDHGTSLTHEVYTNTNPRTGETRTGASKKDTHAPTYEEVKNIENGNAKEIDRNGNIKE